MQCHVIILHTTDTRYIYIYLSTWYLLPGMTKQNIPGRYLVSHTSLQLVGSNTTPAHLLAQNKKYQPRSTRQQSHRRHMILYDTYGTYRYNGAVFGRRVWYWRWLLFAAQLTRERTCRSSVDITLLHTAVQRNKRIIHHIQETNKLPHNQGSGLQFRETLSSGPGILQQ